MDNSEPDRCELAVLDGGPVDGTRVRVAGRPQVLQVTEACEVEPGDGGTSPAVAALHVYRRDPRVKSEPLRYGFDRASP